MPLTVCRCCGGKREPDQLARNPNICLSCEQLLEDDSPKIMADIARANAQEHLDDLLDHPQPHSAKKLRREVRAAEPHHPKK